MATEQQTEPKTYRVIRRLKDGSEGTLGRAVRYPDGWRFLSHTQTGSSRRYWPTAEACLPRGMAYDELRPFCPGGIETTDGHADSCGSRSAGYVASSCNCQAGGQA